MEKSPRQCGQICCGHHDAWSGVSKAECILPLQQWMQSSPPRWPPDVETPKILVLTDVKKRGLRNNTEGCRLRGGKKGPSPNREGEEHHGFS